MPNLAVKLKEKILRLANDLNAPYLYEHSFKLSDQEILDHRLLISLRMAHLGPHPLTALAHICDTLVVPTAYRTILESHMREADNLHLGIEEGSGTFVYKLYLEFARKFKQGVRNARESCGPLLLHLAFKWNPMREGFQTIARYICDPGLGPSEMQRKLSTIYAHRPGAPTHRFASALLEKATRRMPVESLFFLAVEEDDNPRQSFDLCVYDAGFTLSEIEQEVMAMGKYFKIPEGRFARVFEPLRQEKLGHFSGGLGRNGKEFCTLYYGVRRHDPVQPELERPEWRP